MDALTALTTRRSSAKLCAPAPDAQAMAHIVSAMLRAPDHALLRPWRYLQVEGEGLSALGEVFVQAMLKRDPQLTPEAQARYRNMPLRAPLMLIGILSPVEHPKVPVHEQLLSAGCGLHAALLTAHALGFGGIWRTGDLAEDAHVKQALGLAAHEQIVGFLYIGSVEGEMRDKPEPEAAAHVRQWP